MRVRQKEGTLLVLSTARPTRNLQGEPHRARGRQWLLPVAAALRWQILGRQFSWKRERGGREACGGSIHGDVGSARGSSRRTVQGGAWVVHGLRVSSARGIWPLVRLPTSWGKLQSAAMAVVGAARHSSSCRAGPAPVVSHRVTGPVRSEGDPQRPAAVVGAACRCRRHLPLAAATPRTAKQFLQPATLQASVLAVTCV